MSFLSECSFQKFRLSFSFQILANFLSSSIVMTAVEGSFRAGKQFSSVRYLRNDSRSSRLFSSSRATIVADLRGEGNMTRDWKRRSFVETDWRCQCYAHEARRLPNRNGGRSTYDRERVVEVAFVLLSRGVKETSNCSASSPF
jgi:hypothetical protein